MIIRVELARTADRTLTKLQFVGTSGQTYSTTYEVADGQERTAFSYLEQAEEAFQRLAGDELSASSGFGADQTERMRQTGGLREVKHIDDDDWVPQTQ